MSKYQNLLDYLRKYKRIGVSYSGGSDSTLLLKASADAIGAENVFAFTADTDFFTGDELGFAKKFCRSIGIKHFAVKIRMLEDNDIVSNGPERCYFCKKLIMSYLVEMAKDKGCDVLLEGTEANAEAVEPKPGMKATREFGLVSPLYEVGITRNEVADILRELGLRRYILPENPCLATRVETGTRIDTRNLRAVCALETMLHRLGFAFVRVRITKDGTRIEVPEERFSDLLSQKDFLTEEFSAFGFPNVDFAVYKRIERC